LNTTDDEFKFLYANHPNGIHGPEVWTGEESMGIYVSANASHDLILE
jgi:hypothetical protein